MFDVNTGKCAEYFAPETPGYTTSLTWSPDSRRLAFIRGDDIHGDSLRFRIRLLVVEIDDGTVVELYRKNFPDYVSHRHEEIQQQNTGWSPDGKHLFFTTHSTSDSNKSIVFYSTLFFDMTSGKTISIPGKNFAARQWSPDGSALLGLTHLETEVTHRRGEYPLKISRIGPAVVYFPSGEMKIIAEYSGSVSRYLNALAWLKNSAASPKNLPSSGTE